MSIWLVPALLMVAGLVPVTILALGAAEEAENLRRQVRELGRLRPALVDLRSAARALCVSIREMRGT